MKTWHWLCLTLAIGVALRVLTFAAYPAQTFPDSGTYIQAAHDLLSSGGWTGQARRTPGYPLVIALVGDSPAALYLANIGAGLATAALLFALVLRLTGSARAAFAAATLHLVNLQQWFQEANVLTETFSTLSVVAALTLFVTLLDGWRSGRSALPGAVALGALSAYALFVRPQYIALPVLLALAAWLASPAPRLRLRSLTLPAGIAIPAFALVLGWCALVHAKTGYFTMSTQSGFGMVNHPIDYIELAPERYAVVRDILIRVREAQITQLGHSRNTIWYAWPDIQSATGWSLPEASKQLQRMCSEMFVAYPGRYALSVASAWIDFWTVPIFWRPEQIHPQALAGTLQSLWWVEHKLLRGANLLFVLLVAAAVVSPLVRRRLRWDLALTVITLTVLSSSVIQAMADQGASSRYHLPTQSLVVAFLVVAMQRWAAGGATRR